MSPGRAGGIDAEDSQRLVIFEPEHVDRDVWTQVLGLPSKEHTAVQLDIEVALAHPQNNDRPDAKVRVPHRNGTTGAKTSKTKRRSATTTKGSQKTGPVGALSN